MELLICIFITSLITAIIWIGQWLILIALVSLFIWIKDSVIALSIIFFLDNLIKIIIFWDKENFKKVKDFKKIFILSIAWLLIWIPLFNILESKIIWIILSIGWIVYIYLLFKNVTIKINNTYLSFIYGFLTGLWNAAFLKKSIVDNITWNTKDFVFVSSIIAILMDLIKVILYNKSEINFEYSILPLILLVIIIGNYLWKKANLKINKNIQNYLQLIILLASSITLLIKSI